MPFTMIRLSFNWISSNSVHEHVEIEYQESISLESEVQIELIGLALRIKAQRSLLLDNENSINSFEHFDGIICIQVENEMEMSRKYEFYSTALDLTEYNL